MKKLLVVLIFATSMVAEQVPDAPKPKFFNKTSNIEMSLTAASIAVDGFTTRQKIDNHSIFEGNPIARPFANSDGLAAGYFAASFALDLEGNYLLRNHKKMRHIFNWSVISMETFMAYRNMGLSNGKKLSNKLVVQNTCSKNAICAVAY